jgi:hypothetical protein
MFEPQTRSPQSLLRNPYVLHLSESLQGSAKQDKLSMANLYATLEQAVKKYVLLSDLRRGVQS